jgi:hypothetical protein
VADTKEELVDMKDPKDSKELVVDMKQDLENIKEAEVMKVEDIKVGIIMKAPQVIIKQVIVLKYRVLVELVFIMVVLELQKLIRYTKMLQQAVSQVNKRSYM